MEMSVNTHYFILFSLLLFLLLLLLLSPVNGVQHTYVRVSTDGLCACPYSCITTSECATRHAATGTEEVLFNCGEKGKICCPPKNSLSKPFRTRETIKRYSQNCTERNTPEDQSFYDTTTVTSPTKRPYQYQITPESKDTNYYHVPSGIYVHVDENLKSQPKPQEIATSTPIIPLRASNVKRPSFDQAALTTKRPQNLKKQNIPITSHKNFRLLPSESQCGVNNFANRITEGEEVSLGEFPWMALTGVKDRYGNYRWNCGGTLINGWYVLTAAHCLSVDNRTIEYVRLGEHSLRNATDCSREFCLNSPEDVPIAEVIPHEKWNTTTIKNDIALLRLSQNPLLLGNSNIFPICLPTDTKKLNLSTTSRFEVAGWGKTDWNAEEGSDVLLKATISGVNREECNICRDKKKQQYCPITETQLCVQGWKAVDVCKGDSGGPLMLTRLNIYQIGITSFKGSEYCGAENIPSIFTKVESYLPWILDNIKEFN